MSDLSTTKNTLPVSCAQSDGPVDSIEGFDIVCLIHTEWMAVRSTPEHTMTLLRKKNRVLIVEPFNSWPTLMREAAIQKRKRKFRWGVRQAQDNLWVYTPAPLGIPGHTRATWVTPANNALHSLALRRVIRRLGFSRPILWTYLYNTAGVLNRVPAQLKIYDVLDNDAALARNQRHRRMVCLHDEATCRSADVVFVCAEALAEDRRAFNPRLHEVYSAADPVFFGKALDPNLSQPSDLQKLSRPIIGYMGGVDTVKLDVQLIAHIARTRPDWTIVLIGFIWFGFDRSIFADLPNVRLLGGKPTNQIPQYLKHVDVCIAPFALNDTTRYGDSLKIYEYLSAGRPVVSTPIPSAIRIGSPVRIASTPGMFVEQIASALIEGPDHVSSRLEAVRPHTWGHRVSQKSRLILHYLKELGRPAGAQP